jgi:undecaprenyl-diphosphatase
MTLFQAFALGILQGITEFVPVSSSGHLVLVRWLLGWSEPDLTFDILVHVGTLFAVVGYFRHDLVDLTRAWLESLRLRRWHTPQARVAWLLLLSAVPGGLLGFLFSAFFETLFGAPRAVSLLLLVTGSLLLLGEWLSRRQAMMEDIRTMDALVMGFGQALAIAPGISRSGSTMAAGLLRGLRRSEAARFAFLMLLPITVGAAGLQIFRLITVPGAMENAVGVPQLLIGLVTSAFSGVLAVHFLLAHLTRRGLRPFAYYCFGAGLFFFILTFVR